MAFPDSFIEELISRNEISDVVSSYVQLNKKSGNNMFGLCPFHSEKTPSFSVSVDKQMYYCFGCQKGGGVINFIMEIEALGYPDAVHFLARRAGLTVPEEDRDDGRLKKRERMLLLNRDAAKFFYGNLSAGPGETAVNYLNRRKISREMAVRFGVGAAPDSWNGLTDAMTKKGYEKDELLAAGLVKRGKTGGIYDTFRNRLMFPVVDIRGNVIGFSGRILDDGEPKYLNSPDTMVFNKSRNLFGMNLAKKSKAGYILLVEGNIDVVALHQAGFDSAVASLGTSLTAEQSRLIARYTDNVIIAFDSDNAGVNAAKRAIGILERTGLHVKVLRMQGAKDPDEFIKKKGAEAFQLLIEQSENHIEYRLLSMRAGYDLEQDEDRLSYFREAVQLLATLKSAAEREIYGRRVAEAVGISFESVEAEVKKAFRRNIQTEKKKHERDVINVSQSAQPKERSMRYGNTASARAEEGIIRLLMLDPALAGHSASLTAEDFSSPFLAKAYEVIKGRLKEGKDISIPALSSEFESHEISQLTKIIREPESLASGEKTLENYINKIKTEKLKQNPNENLEDIFKKYREDKGVEG